MILEPLPAILAVARLDVSSSIPDWATRGTFFSISKTDEELSIVCDQSLVPAGIRHERDWRALKVKGPLDFSLTGILSSLASPLANARISIFAISTFDTDYILIKQEHFAEAIRVLEKAQHVIEGP